MHSLQKQFHDFLEREELLNQDNRTLVAVSGGMDSMVLASLFLSSKRAFAVAHCNFGLRATESDGDEGFVRDWCEKNGVVFYCKKFDLEDESIQLAARNARYEWFKEMKSNHDYDKLATAHHLNDSLETTLINLTRGTGPKGIGGIKSKAGDTIRPLLFATKDDLKSYALESGLEWREDSSNQKTDYDRNLIRLELIPKLSELNPSLISTFADTSERLQMADQLVREKVQDVKEKYLNTSVERTELSTEWINQKSDLLVLSEILSDFGFNYVTCKEIFEALDKSGKRFESNKYRLSVDRNSIIMNPLSESLMVQLTAGEPGAFPFDGGRLSIESTQKGEVDYTSAPKVVFVDESKIKFPLTLRNWEEGDRFQSLGMSGSKKVSDFLIDKKVPLADKENIKVLVSDGKIVWIAGHQISETVKIDDNTTSVLRLELI